MRGYARFLLIALAGLWNTQLSFAQEKRQTFFTVDDGLPSNYIYRTLEDDKGFLWVPTNAGVARFDGKYFQVFTTKDGLPDNEVFGVVKEKDGRIWVECFNQIPAYFDEKQNRFVVPYLEKALASKMINTLGTYLRPLPDGGIIYANRDKSIIFKNGEYKKSSPLINKMTHCTTLREFPDGSTLICEGVYNPAHSSHYQIKLYHIKEDRIQDSALLVQYIPGLKGSLSALKKVLFSHGIYMNEGNIYLGVKSANKFYIYSNIQLNPIRWETDSLLIPEPHINYFFTANRLAVIGESGKIFLYDRHTLKPVKTLNSEGLINSYFNDSKGNEWISTIDKGLILSRNAALKPLPMPASFTHLNFMSILPLNNGTILAGNYNGEVVEIRPGKTKIHAIIQKSPARIRKILVAGGNVYTISEEGIYCNFKTRLPDPTATGLSFGKTAVKYNDTTILIATNRNLIRLNTKTNRLYELNSTLLRVTALTMAGDQVYFGSIKGLYKYNFKTNSGYIPLSESDSRLAKRVSSVYYAADGLLWVLQADNTLLALKNDRVIFSLSPDNELSNSTNKQITGGKAGQLWISASNGIKVISYSWKANKMHYTSRNISVKDGLAGNEVEEISYHEGKMYVATNNGISVVPDDYVAPGTAIRTYLVEMDINQRDTILADHYHLSYDHRDLRMRFAGVDLSGFFGFFQYQLDEDRSWSKLQGNTLTLQLRAGRHTLKVRAVDVNGNVSDKQLLLRFDVATPFWLNTWFWLIAGIIIQLILIYVISQHQKKKKEAKLARRITAVQTAALEQQAFTSLMNPHFMFNALNSIQYYINVQDRQNANRYLSDFASLIRKNFEAAQESFIALEEEVENMKLYLNLEQMRFAGKFDYKITIDKALDVEDWMIPTMILQPLLENALLHGIMPSSLPGKLNIRFKLIHHHLLIHIQDNGIGMANSKALKAGSTHKSSGMELIRKRINALGNFDTPPITMEMEPAYKSRKNPGNRITLCIPAALFPAWLRAKHRT